MRLRLRSCLTNPRAATDARTSSAADAELLGGSVEVGNRGGIQVSGFELNVPLEAE